jgi:hypothetical protein
VVWREREQQLRGAALSQSATADLLRDENAELRALLAAAAAAVASSQEGDRERADSFTQSGCGGHPALAMWCVLTPVRRRDAAELRAALETAEVAATYNEKLLSVRDEELRVNVLERRRLGERTQV